MKRRLAIVTSHPIQYNAPLFQQLAKSRNIELMVYYTLEPLAVKYDKEFGKTVEWDIPLLEGYNYEFVSNKGNSGKRFVDVKNWDLEKRLKKWNAEFVMVLGWNYFSHLRIIKKFNIKAKVMFRGDSTLLNDTPGLKANLRKLFLRWVYSDVDIFLYVGQNNKEYYKRFGAPEKKLVYAGHAVDNSRFLQSAESEKDRALQWRRGNGIKDNDVVFLFAGKFYDLKQPLLLLEAFIQLNLSNAHLIMVGDGIMVQEMKELANNNKNVHFLPFQNQSEMPFIYQLCDVFCLPSKSETWGLSVNEAMACGKAILVSDKVGCAIDLVKDSVNGSIFKTGDITSLKEKIQFLNNRMLIAEMGQESLAIISSFTFSNIALSIENVITEF